MNNILMKSYDLNSSPLDNVLSSDGLHFDYDRPFFLIANLPIKNKTMFEINITDYYPINKIQHIPLYVGISREPSLGVLIADYAISSLFYDVTDPRYEILSNEIPDNVLYIDGSSTDADGNSVIGTRKPGIGDTIGVAVDYHTNKIKLFVNYNNEYPYDGEYDKPFYSYTPPFNLAEQPNMYFCIYSNINYKYIEEDYNFRIASMDDLKHISGYVNFGKNGLTHPVPGYDSLYKAYYERMADQEIHAELGSDDNPCYVYIGGDVFNPYSIQWDGELSVENELEPDTDNLALVTDDPEFITTKSNKYNMNANTYIKADYDFETGEDNKYGITNSYKVGGNVYINYPIPTTDKVYFEYTVKEGELKDRIVGIPIAMGITSVPLVGEPSQEKVTNPNTIMTESIRVNLYRGNCFIPNGLDNSGGFYLFHLVRHSTQNSDKNDLHYLENVETSISPEQGNTIGVALDLGNNLMDIYIEGIKLASLNLKYTKENIDFSDFNKDDNGKMQYPYFFIHDEGVFNNKVTGTFNFGESKFDSKIPKGYKSLYDFYTVDKRRIISKDLNCTVNINAEKIVSKFIDSYLNINRVVDVKYEGLNDMILSNNNVDDFYAHYFEFDTDGMNELNELIRKENNGLMLTHKERSLDIDYSNIPIYKVNITKYTNQRIIVECNGKTYTESFEVPEYSLITVRTEAIDGKYKYTPGTPSVTRAVITSNTTLTATPASYKEYNVIINQVQNQIITVYNLKDGVEESHTASFVVNSRYPHIRAEITYIAEGFNKGVLNITEADVTEDTIIYSTKITDIRYNITIEATIDELITVTAEGIPRTNSKGINKFTIGYNKYCRVSVKSIKDGYIAGSLYYYGKDGVKHDIVSSIQVTEDITIGATKVVPDVVYITIDNSEANEAKIDVTNVDKVSDTKYSIIRNRIANISTKPKAGYYFDHYEIEYKNKK